MDLLIVVGIMLVVWVLLSWLAWSNREDFKGYSGLYKGEITTNFNAIPFARNSRKFIYKKWQEVKPKSGIDKEIAEEEKEIAELERQKEKMDTLEELKRRKERLFSESIDTPKRENISSDIPVSYSGNKNRLDVEFIGGWHKIYYSYAYNLDEIKQACHDGKTIIEEDVRL